MTLLRDDEQKNPRCSEFYFKERFKISDYVKSILDSNIQYFKEQLGNLQLFCSTVNANFDVKV